MTTLFPINHSKLASFMDSLDDVLNHQSEHKSNKYGFNFENDTPKSNQGNTNCEHSAISDFKWTLLADEDLQMAS